MRSALLIKLSLVTVVMVTAAFYATVSVRIRGLTPLSFNAVEVIRRRCPIHLVNPAPFTGRDQSDILFRWSVVEIRARLAVISILWTLTLFALIWHHWRKRNQKKSH